MVHGHHDRWVGNDKGDIFPRLLPPLWPKVDRGIGTFFEKVFGSFWKNTVERTEMGLVPKEYNPKVHGPYSPSRYYGKPDTAFGELKVGEIPGWIARRQKGFTPLARLVSRGYWRWMDRFMFAKYGGAVWYYQLVAGLMLFYYIVRLDHYYYHRQYRYHW